MWASEEVAQSSTFRELKDILNVLVSYASQLQSKRVIVKTESHSEARIVSVGSSKSHLRYIFQLCLKNAIVLEAQRIPRSLKEKALMLSQFIDPDDWSLHPSVFLLLNARWGPHTMYRFASHYNAQLPLFNSKDTSPGSCGVDAFIQNWSRWENWLCPPVNLVTQCVRHLEARCGCYTLIIPECPSAVFWPFGVRVHAR